MTDIAVVGGGIAGMTAAIGVRRHGYSCVVIDPVHGGGQLANIAEVRDYSGSRPGTAGSDLAAALLEEATTAGCELRFGEVDQLAKDHGLWHLAGSAVDVDARAVIVATGSTLAELGVPGEAEFRGRGVITCATCDGWAFKGKRICLVGGGDSAVDEAMYLASLAERITMVFRGPAISAHPESARRLSALPHIDQIPHATISGIVGHEMVEAVRVRHLSDGTEELLPVEGVGVYIGLRPNARVLEGFASVSTDGHVLTDSELHTGNTGLFVAGDVRSGCAALFESCAKDGARAARSAATYVSSAQMR